MGSGGAAPAEPRPRRRDLLGIRFEVTEIGGAHLTAGQHLVRRSLDDHLAEVEYVAAVGECGDEFDVVLDEQDGEALLRLHFAQRLSKRVGLGAVETRRRLVEQQHFRLGHERTADLDQAALAEAQPFDRLIGQRLQSEQREHLVAPRQFVWLRAAEPDYVFPQPTVAATDALGDEEVVAHRRVREQFDALEGTADAQASTLAHPQTTDVLAVDLDGAPVEGQYAENAVEERGLAGTVRSDEPDAFTLLDLDADAVERDDAREPLRQLVRLQHRAHRATSAGCGEASLTADGGVVSLRADCRRSRLRADRRRLLYSRMPSG